MKRLFSGSVLFATSLVLVSCKGDPTSDFREPTRITADPASIFLPQGSVKSTVVRLEDDQGDPIASTWEIAGGTGFAVVQDPNFLGTTVGAPLEAESQFIVTAGEAPGASSFTLTSSSGLSIDIPVRVTPTSLTATFSNPTPAVNEVVTLTAPGYVFLPGATVAIGGTPALILGSDANTISFLPLPGSVGTAEVVGIATDFLPTTPLTLETTTELTVPVLTPLAGTDAPGTAPEITVPASGATTTFFDGGTYDYQAPILGGAFGTFPSRLYKIVIPVDGDYTISLDWEGGVEDLGIYPFLTDGTTEVGAPADGAAHPEVGVQSLTAGTYLLAMVNFSGTNPPSITIQITSP